MKRILVIGIGAGDPDHLTMGAIKALNRADVFFVFDKGDEKAELTALRREICERYITGKSYRIVEIADPARDGAVESYGARVEAWHRARADLVKAGIALELGAGQTGAFLVWGGPELYDSTLRILQHVLDDDPAAFAVEVVPGITSLQVLAARHGVALNTIGGSVHITTGRKLKAGIPEGCDSVAVMLDDGSGLDAVSAGGLDIYWGAYLGMGDEILVSGELEQVRGEILETRRREKERKGWIMDTYLLRRRKGE